MDGTMTQLDLPGLPDQPLREYFLTGTLERPGGAPPPAPLTWPPVVECVHTADLSHWELTVRAGSAGMALSVAEMVLPEAAGASWTVSPVAAGVR